MIATSLLRVKFLPLTRYSADRNAAEKNPVLGSNLTMVLFPALGISDTSLDCHLALRKSFDCDVVCHKISRLGAGWLSKISDPGSVLLAAVI